MKAWERSRELIGIMIIGWITLLIVLIVIDKVIVPISIPKPNYLYVFIEGLIKLIGAALIALIWLAFWKALVNQYKRSILGQKG